MRETAFSDWPDGAVAVRRQELLVDRLSLNQITAKSWSLPEAVRGCAEREVGWIGLWRDRVAEVGVTEAAKLVRDHGIGVSSLCRGGFFPGDDEDARHAAIAHTRQGLEDAARLGTDCLVLVCGGIARGDLPGSRRDVADAIEQLVPDAERTGVRLAIEPLHPMYCADRSVVATLDQALVLAAPYPPEVVGVAVDAFHVWWDPGIFASIAAASGRILGFHVCDWLVPLPDVLLGRGLPGEGPIDLRALKAAVDAAGYRGPIEVEVFNAELWAMDGGEVLDRTIGAYRTHVA